MRAMGLQRQRSPALLVCFFLSLLPGAAQEGGKVTLQFLSFPRIADPEPVELVVGDEFVIKPGKHTILRPQADERTFQTALYFRKDDDPGPFFRSKWPVSNGARGLIFFYHDPKTQRLRLHTIRDFLSSRASAESIQARTLRAERPGLPPLRHRRRGDAPPRSSRSDRRSTPRARPLNGTHRPHDA